ncbi:MAG: hypothetical protein RQ729_08645 [Wenzhouxiangellaceae bacterium]|nr:hypothetical protein [Wenzhouxiangellaceae bacterium]
MNKLPKVSMSRVARIASALALTGAAMLAHGEPMGYAINSRGNLTDDQMHVLWQIDLATGSSRRIGKVGNFIDVEGLAIGADGTLYGADDSSKTVFTINLNSGFPSALGGVISNMGVPLGQALDVGLTATCDDQLLLVSDVERSLFRVDRASGQISRIGSAGSLAAPITDIAARAGELYGIGEGLDGSGRAASPDLYRIDIETATATRIGALGPQVAPYANAGLAFDDQGRLWAVTDRRQGDNLDLPSQIIQIDPETGAALAVRDADLVGFESLAIAPPSGCADDEQANADAPPAIPASSPWSLALMALVLLLAGRWTLLRTQR